MDASAQTESCFTQCATQDVPYGAISGWWVLILALACFAFSGLSFVGGLVMLLAPTAFGPGIILLVGLITTRPRQAAVLTLFRHHKGTIAQDGLWRCNPLTAVTKVSLATGGAADQDHHRQRPDGQPNRHRGGRDLAGSGCGARHFRRR